MYSNTLLKTNILQVKLECCKSQGTTKKKMHILGITVKPAHSKGKIKYKNTATKIRKRKTKNRDNLEMYKRVCFQINNFGINIKIFNCRFNSMHM